MMGTNGTGASHVEGIVASSNERGLKLQGGEWLTYSKWGDAISPPQRGQTVSVTLDGRGFVRTVTPLDGPPEAATGAVAGRETVITRLAVLKAATQFTASRPDLKSADLFALAERMEAWVNRD